MSGIIKSFKDAFNGIYLFILSGRNARIQIAIFIIVIIAGFLFNITGTEWALVLILSALVLSMEVINTALEGLCDKVESDWNEQIKRIKDMAAGSVLIVSIIAAIVGLIIFLPYLLAFIK